jgi:hypothetical protein
MKRKRKNKERFGTITTKILSLIKLPVKIKKYL